MKREPMSYEQAVKFLYGIQLDENRKQAEAETPSYQQAVRVVNKAVRENPQLRDGIAGEKLTIGQVLDALVEAGKTGLDYNARMNEERVRRRKIIAERIKQTRQMHKLTQEEISDIIGWNVLTYRGYENCKSDVPIVILIRLADHYGVTMDYLTDRTSAPHDLTTGSD